jgi:hypothetical protein
MQLKVDKCSVDTTILNAEDTSQTVSLFEVGPNDYIFAIMGRVKTAFAGVTLPEVYVGLDTGGGIIIKKQPLNKVGDLLSGGSLDGRFCQKIPAAAQSTEANRTINGYFSSSTGNFSDLSGGQVDFVCIRATA